MAVLLINGEAVDAVEFAWDGCHKVYLIANDDDRQRMQDYGYTDEGDILPIDELPEIWEVTCPLRFISSADLSRDYIEQCEDGTVEVQG